MGEFKRINFSRFKNFMTLSNGTKVLFLEAFFFLTISRILILIYTFKKIAKKLGEPMNESSFDEKEGFIVKSVLIGKMVKKASAYSPMRSLCFEQALAAKFMLKRRSIPCTIYFGVSKDVSEKIKAHAWTRVGNKFVTGGKGKEGFQVISTYS